MSIPSLLWSRLPVRTLTTSASRYAPKPNKLPRAGPSNSAPKAPEDKIKPDDSFATPNTTSTLGPLLPPRSSVPTLSLDFSADDVPLGPGGVGRTGAKSSKGSLSTSEKTRKAYARFISTLCALGLVGTVAYMGREWEYYEIQDRSKEDMNASRWQRTQIRISEMADIFSKPQWKELLPPPMPPPHGKPYTLLLSLDDLLITSVWDRQGGWRTAKRPGVDYFLAYLSQFFEVVIFTTQPHYTAIPVIDLLDRYRFFLTYHLFRESTRVSKDGLIVKDLTYLNRDLSKVIILDTHPDHVSLQPENAIIVKPWKGDSGASGLVGLIPFLESVAFFSPPDVRPILKAYADKDIAVEYAKHEEKEKQKFLNSLPPSKRTATSKLSVSNIFGNFSGTRAPPADQPLTYLEQRRFEAQQAYLREQKYIEENKEILEGARQEEIDRQKEMAGSLLGWFSAMSGKPPGEKDAPPPPSPIAVAPAVMAPASK